MTAPLFDEVTWKTSTGNVRTIKKPGKGQALTVIKVNGTKNNGYFIAHDLFKQGDDKIYRPMSKQDQCRFLSA